MSPMIGTGGVLANASYDYLVSFFEAYFLYRGIIKNNECIGLG